jgi:hypothetical protein
MFGNVVSTGIGNNVSFACTVHDELYKFGLMGENANETGTSSIVVCVYTVHDEL